MAVALAVRRANRLTWPVRLQTITKMYRLPWERGRGPHTSQLTSDIGSAGGSAGCKRPSGAELGALARPQGRQPRTNSVQRRLAPGNQYSFNRRRYVP